MSDRQPSHSHMGVPPSCSYLSFVYKLAIRAAVFTFAFDLLYNDNNKLHANSAVKTITN